MPTLAMKSAGPKISAASLGEAVAICSTATRPAASSICASIAIWPERQARLPLDLAEQEVEPDHVRGSGDLGQDDRVDPGSGPLDDLDHVLVGPLGQRVVDPDRAERRLPGAVRPSAVSASMTSVLAASLAAGATASSRSRISSSAARLLALARKRSLLPGTVRQDRRGRSAVVMGR